MSLKRSTAGASQKTVGRSTRTAAATVDPLDPSQLDVNIIGWNNIDARFQELRGMLSAPASGLNAQQARTQQHRNVSAAIVQLLDRAQQDCRRLLIEGNAKAAVEGGLKTLRLKEAYYGHGHLQLVPAYFHLARTNQYMDKFKAAEEFLSLAQWTILRNKDVDVSLKAELHQTFGLLYASDAKLDAALKQLTSATYYLCLMNGPEHILTSFGYFDLGNVFAAKSNMEHAMAFYDKVKDIWYTHLTMSLRHALEPESSNYSEEPTSSSNMLVAANFGIENLQDAVKMLRGIVGLQTERYGRVHPSTARSEYVLGMFMLWNGDAPSAMGSLLKALEISKRVFGDRHPNTGEVRSLMLNFHLEVPDDTAYVLEDGFEPDKVVPAPQQPTRVPTPPTTKKPVPVVSQEPAPVIHNVATEDEVPSHTEEVAPSAVDENPPPRESEVATQGEDDNADVPELTETANGIELEAEVPNAEVEGAEAAATTEGDEAQVEEAQDSPQQDVVVDDAPVEAQEAPQASGAAEEVSETVQEEGGPSDAPNEAAEVVSALDEQPTEVPTQEEQPAEVPVEEQPADENEVVPSAGGDAVVAADDNAVTEESS